jgi:hypothetical protein
MTDWKKFVEEKKGENSELFARMDSDRDLALAAPFTVKDAGGRAIKGIHNVTLPDPKLFAHRAITRITSVERQTVIESDVLTDEQTTLVEHFLDDIAYEADARRAAIGETDVFGTHAETVCVRGPVAEQVMLYARGERLIADIRPLDTRYFLSEISHEGINKAVVISERSAVDIYAEYGRHTPGKSAEVWDCWDAAGEYIYIAGQKIAENPNTYGEAPFVTQRPAAGTTLKDTGCLKRRGESVFYLCRNECGGTIWDELNYVASILKSQAAETVQPPQQLPAPPEGEYQAVPESYPSAGEMITTKLPMQLVPKPDVRESTRMYYTIIEKARQLATFSILDSGILEFPLSAVAYQQALSRRNELLLPRLQALAQLQQSAARMKIRQFQRLGRTLKLGEPGHQRTYKPADLAGEYVIKFRFRPDAAESRASDLAYANAARGFYSEDRIRREVLKMQNPEAEQAQFEAEAARKADPVIGLFEQMCGLVHEQEAAKDIEVKMVKDLEARSLLATIMGIIKQRQITQNQPMKNDIQQPAMDEAAGQQLLNVFGGKNPETGGI